MRIIVYGFSLKYACGHCKFIPCTKKNYVYAKLNKKLIVRTKGQIIWWRDVTGFTVAGQEVINGHGSV